MRAARLLGLLLAAIALAVMVASNVAASQPRGVSMTFKQDFDTYENLGWKSTGAIVDEGDWLVTRLVLGSPKTMLFGDVDTVQTSPTGSFRLQWHGGTTPVGGVAASWRLFGGTGAYAGLRGEGHWSQYVDNGILTFEIWGTVH